MPTSPDHDFVSVSSDTDATWVTFVISRSDGNNVQGSIKSPEFIDELIVRLQEAKRKMLK